MLITEITARNLLSFGPEGISLPLKPLNVLIGPNGSGKSNLLDVISILQAAPNHIAKPIRDTGGIRDWIWKGNPRESATIEAFVKYPHGNVSLHYRVKFTERAQRFEMVHEFIVNPDRVQNNQGPSFSYEFNNGVRKFVVRGTDSRAVLQEESISDESVLSRLKDPDRYPEITYLGNSFNNIFQFRNWEFGHSTQLRDSQKADQRNDHLEEPDYINWRLVLNRLSRDLKVKREILDGLRQLYDGIEDFDFIIEGGTIQVFFHESNFQIPATRLSDGTLRYLCLLIILCDPTPPKLVCIEEPELGLHPDIIPGLADLLVEASKRTQLIVTTHSDILVDALSETPESVVVCEKHEGQTTMERLDENELSKWLDKYRLGQLWIKGELGGKRW